MTTKEEFKLLKQGDPVKVKLLKSNESTEDYPGIVYSTKKKHGRVYILYFDGINEFGTTGYFKKDEIITNMIFGIINIVTLSDFEIIPNETRGENNAK